jgi:hypothetical protein
MYPMNWVMPVAMLILMLASRIAVKRVPRTFFVLLAVSICIAWLKAPFLYAEGFDLVVFVACFSWIFMQKIKEKTGKKMNPAPFIPALFLPLTALIMPIITTTANSRQQIHLTDREMEWDDHKGQNQIDRGELDITYERAWLGNGYYWGFYDRKKAGGVVESDGVYWTGQFPLITGDELAHRISLWSNSKPRFIINGDPRG